MIRSTLKASLASLSLLFSMVPDSYAGAILREVYLGIGGTAISDLTNSPSYPQAPSSTNLVTDFFEAPTDIAENYGQRMRGFVIAPQTGNYVFWVSSDDNGSLYLSTDEQPTHKNLVASVPEWSGSREWTKYPAQQSNPVQLVAGQRYYIEALQKEGGGGDNLAVRWQLPDTTIEEPIPAARLLPFWGDSTTAPSILTPPSSQNVLEGTPASFSVLAGDPAPVSYQWQLNESNIPNATNAAYTYPNTTVASSGSRFRCILTNPIGSTTSATATLTISTDTTLPTIVNVLNVGTSNIWVTFSKAVETASATSILNYSVSGGVSITGIGLSSDNRTAMLTTSLLAYGQNYTISVSGVRDQASVPNTILPNSQFTFLALEYSPTDIGKPVQNGSVSVVTNGFNITGGGLDVGGTADQFQFSYQTRTGDFDVSTRVAGLAGSDTWAKAGLMARENTGANSRFTAAFTTPSLAGSFFAWRDPAGAASQSSGNFPANYPNTWLRLKRVGTQFTGFAGTDGKTWQQLGSVNISLPSTVLFGFAVSSHTTNQTTTAQFRDVQTVQGATALTAVSTREPLGPSSRKTGLVISEIMYKPAFRADGRNLEFIEIFNTTPFDENISGHRLSGAVDYTFPAGTILHGGAVQVIAASPGDLQAVYGLANILGPYTNSLKKAGTLRLRSEVDAVLQEVPYSNITPWPVAADGTGHSIVLARPSYGEADPRAWSISDLKGGSPGLIDPVSPEPLGSVVINEFLVNATAALPDYLELYNHSAQAIDLSGAFLSDSATTNKFRIPDGTSIPARGLISFNDTQLGFRPSPESGTFYLVNSNQTRVVDAVQYEGQEDGISQGRFPDGASEIYRLKAQTPGAANSNILIDDIVINELMYKPISGDNNDQYVELFNQGQTRINVGLWQFTSGINFTLPANTFISPGDYLIVAENATNLLAHYTNLTAAKVLGNFGGSLAGKGERLALAKPTAPLPGSTNSIYVVVDEVTYEVGGRWGQWANGGGSSLELIDPHSNHRLAANWADSDESQKAPWTNIENTGVLDNGSGAIDFVQIGILNAGEAEVDNIEAHSGTSAANLITNPDFEANLSGWTPEGDHFRSSRSLTEGYNSTHSLILRASDSVWTGANSVVGTMTSPSGLASGQTATLRFKARWLRGWPEVLLRFHGNWLEAVGRMTVPTNLGSPGSRNSKAIVNAGPAIYEVSHSPSIPAANQNVVVTARAHDVDGLQSVSLFYRLDPATTYTQVSMVDNGTGGDAVAGDGIYSATIPGKAAGQLVAFYVQAADTLAASTRFPALVNDNAPVRECLVYFGDTTPISTFGTYHYWLTQNNINRWVSLTDLSNEPIDGTWVYGNRIIYNMQGHYAGSPYHQQFDAPNGSPAHYHCAMPDDDKFLGTTSFNKIHAPGNGPFDDDTIQREQMSYFIARQLGLPWNYRRYVALYINGNRRGTLMEDTQVPGGDVVDERFSDDTDGDLFKLQPWFEFPANGTGMDSSTFCTLNRYTTPGVGFKKARYRWNFLARKVGTTSDNFTNVFALVDAANLTAGSPAFIQNMEAQADMEQWMRTFASVHSVGDWDHVGTQNSQNMYAYKPTQGKWQLMIWDSNIVLGNGSWGSGQNLFNYPGGDQGQANIYNTPAYQRALWRAYKEIANRIMDPNLVNPVMDQKYREFTSNGIKVNSPSVVERWIAATRASIIQQLNSANANAAFAINGGTTFTTNKDSITLTGTAPVEVKTITVNGIAYPVSWTGINIWSLKLVLTGATNQFVVAGLDLSGIPVASASQTLNINYSGALNTPQGRVVINEIMYNAVAPDASFVELLNTSTVNAFDLTGFRLEGADLTFPGGSLIQPGGYLVVAGDAEGFARAYGRTIPLAAVYNGRIANQGETLRLVKPGATFAQDTIINQVSYESIPPWPTVANGGGPSLQLIDPAQNNNRVMNWGTAKTNATNAAQQWQYVQVTGAATTSRLYVYLLGTGDAYLDDIKIVAGTDPDSGPNLLRDGDFETALSDAWTITANVASSSTSTNYAHSGNSSLHLVSAAAGSSVGDSLWQDTGPLVTNATYTLSYWWLPNTNGGSLTLRLSGGGLRSEQGIAPPIQVTTAPATPGAANSVKASVPTFPSLWLNEVQTENLTGIRDHLGHNHPWVELYNSGTNAISLSGISLANNYRNTAAWSFPANATINAGQFLVVFLDGAPGESTTNELHASFTIPPATGSVALYQTVSGQTRVLDYLNYNAIRPDFSYGAYPDGTPDLRQTFYFATPGAANTRALPEFPITINEWMAKNKTTIPDPADNKFNDWFELYNSSDTTLDLSGFALTDNLTNSTKFVVPAGFTIPAHGHLLVWADNASSKNNPTQQMLHTNFKLNGSVGGAIGIFAPNSTNIDSVTYGPQTNDISQGRWPDGTVGQVYFMTTPTPGEANVFNGSGNQAPVINPIGDQNIGAGSALTLAITASDPDAGQTLTYSLDPGSPVGASIDQNSGVFSWTPTASQAPSTNLITVRVADNGTPSLSATKSFTVFVAELFHPQFTGITQVEGGSVKLNWSTQPGKTYRVEYKDDLAQTDWLLVQDVVATGTSASITKFATGTSQRFYRIRQLD